MNKPLDGSFAKVCIELRIPDLTKNVPLILKENVAIDKIIVQNFKIDLFSNFFLSFFRSYFASIFCRFFVYFKSFETLKIVLPCRREHYFYKIDVFASSPKID